MISCSSDPNLFNSGYDQATGGVLPDNSQDANWEVAGPYFNDAGTTPVTATAYPAPADLFAPANVGDLAPWAYAASPYSNSQWISQQTIASSNQGTGGGVGDWYYRYQFSLDPSVDPATFRLALNFMADNSLAQVWVNGVAQSPLTTGLPQAPAGQNPYYYRGYNTAGRGSTSLSQSRQAGLNTIVAELKSGAPIEALQVQAQPTTLCPTLTETLSVVGRVQPTDQFTLALEDSSGAALSSLTSAGSQTQLSSAPELGVVGSSYRLVDTMAPGSADPLSYYSLAASCTDTTTGAAVPITGSGPSWTLTVSLPDAYSCRVSNTARPQVNLGLSQTASPNPYLGGQALGFTVTVTNSGPDSALGATLTDTLPAPLSPAGFSWVCAASAGSSCGGAGSGSISDQFDLAPGGTLTYLLSGPVPLGSTSQLSNTAVVTSPSQDIDPNCAAGCAATVLTGPDTVGLSVSAGAGSDPYRPGSRLSYTFTVHNAGPSAAAGLWVAGTLSWGPAGTFRWSCQASPGSSCSASGVGDIADTASLAVGGTLTYYEVGRVPSWESGVLGAALTVTPPAGSLDPSCGPDCSAPAAATLAASVPDTGTAFGPGLGLLLVGLLLAALGSGMLLERRPRGF